MRVKGVLLLALIVCWTTCCNGKDEFRSIDETEDTLSEELAEEHLFPFRVKRDNNEEPEKDDGTSKEENECDCGSNGKCNKGGEEPKCICDPGYSEKDGTCETCDCGEGGTCSFVGDNKECSCNKGFGKKGDKCEACDCGEGGTCSFVGDNKECSCNKGFVKKGDKCEECNCGDKGNCSFDKGNKKCECPKDYAEDNGLCKECTCEGNKTCSFVNGKKKCECSKGYADNDGTCEACDCGVNGKCYFKDGDKECNCTQSFVVKESDGKCHKCDCGPGGTCEFNEDAKECTCNEGYIEINNTCKECNCGENGDCSFEKNGTKKCECHDNYAVKKVGNKETCAEICEDDCKNEGECKAGTKGGEKVCFCKTGFEGDKCDTITECKSGRYSECDGSGGDCKLEGSKPVCVCKDEAKTLDESLERPICKEKCNNDCQNGGECVATTKLCKCKRNTSGDKCENFKGCDSLKCESQAAKCVYDINNERATCQCQEKYYFEDGKCKPEWCKNRCNSSISTCEYTDGVGICHCKSKGTYYNYATDTCLTIDACFNMTCEGDLSCRNGKCDCPEKHNRNGTVCTPMDLCQNKGMCFTGATCEAGSSFGYVKCSCDSATKFYLPRNSRCYDGTCFLPDERKNCTKACPQGMSFKDGDCVHEKDELKCEKECGFLGWCRNETKGGQKCVCTPDYAELDKKSEKCVLKASAVCPTAELEGDGKCKCTGKYKQAKNGITCELKSCSDEEVKEECKAAGATCVEDWRNDVGYKCVCPDGYFKDSTKHCVAACSNSESKDECSSNGQLCFIGDRDKVGECRCQPTFTYDQTRKSCQLNGENTIMIRRLPVLSEKYKIPGDSINKAVLNRDVSTSMKQTFSNLDFVHVYDFEVKEGVLLCDVWLQFKSGLPSTFNATLEAKRWRSVTVEGQDEILLPPRLLLSSSLIDEVSEEELTVCSDSVRQSVCGSGSTCDKNRCSCDPGFKEIESTIKASDKKRIVRCEDIDECTENKHNCSENSECVNTLGDYFCKCKPGFTTSEGDSLAMNKEACIGLCDLKPCNKGTCQLVKENTIDCTCQAGYSGSFCNRADVNLAKAGKATKVVGAVLGTLLAIVIILIIVYVVRQRKNSYSEDFTPAPRVDNAEMIERRPMRGVTNRAYQ